jgi:hypothetical protein
MMPPVGDPGPAHGITVAFTVYNRPDLLARVLDGWSRVRHVDEVVLTFDIEPGNAEVVELCERVEFAERYVHVNPVRLGHAANLAQSMNRAVAHSGYAIFTLDDYLPATDLLELHQWHRQRYAADPTVLCLRSGTDYCHHNNPAAVWRTQLMGAPAGFHRHMWRELYAHWDQATDQGWWAWVNANLLQSGPGLWVLAPSYSRAEDIGEDHPSSCFLPDPQPREYFEVTSARERAIGFARFIEQLGG